MSADERPHVLTFRFVSERPASDMIRDWPFISRAPSRGTSPARVHHGREHPTRSGGKQATILLDSSRTDHRNSKADRPERSESPAPLPGAVCSWILPPDSRPENRTPGRTGGRSGSGRGTTRERGTIRCQTRPEEGLSPCREALIEGLGDPPLELANCSEDRDGSERNRLLRARGAISPEMGKPSRLWAHRRKVDGAGPLIRLSRGRVGSKVLPISRPPVRAANPSFEPS